MSEWDAFKMVELRANVEVNGRKIQARSAVNLETWNAGPEYQDHMKADLLRVLGEEIVKGLAPEVEVVMPKPTLQEALAEALRPFDYPNEY
jgi:hypothetical protein